MRTAACAADDRCRKRRSPTARSVSRTRKTLFIGEEFWLYPVSIALNGSRNAAQKPSDHLCMFVLDPQGLAPAVHDAV